MRNARRWLGAGLALVASLCLLVLGALSLVAGTDDRPSEPVTAVEVHAQVTRATSVHSCSADTDVEVTFSWHGERVTESYFNIPCDRAYRAGDQVTAYVASNDPSDIQPTARWILHPDEYNPFDPFGPNGDWLALVVLGGALLCAALGLLAVGIWLGVRE